MSCSVYQTVTTPNGLIFSQYGLVVGRRHNISVLRESGLNEALKNSLNVYWEQFYIFGDKCYDICPLLQAFFINFTSSTENQVFNTYILHIREAVEWSYKDLKQLWTRNDFAGSLKFHQLHISLRFISSTSFLNFKQYLESGGQVCTYVR